METVVSGSLIIVGIQVQPLYSEWVFVTSYLYVFVIHI
jgi:hypothetical protein